MNQSELLEMWQGGKEERLHIRIFNAPKIDQEKTAQVGHNCYKQAAQIIVKAEGVTDYIARPITEEDKMRFPEAWEHYQKRNEIEKHGTGVRALQCVSETKALELEGLGLEFIEDLAKAGAGIPNIEEAYAEAVALMEFRSQKDGIQQERQDPDGDRPSGPVHQSHPPSNGGGGQAVQRLQDWSVSFKVL